MPSAMVHQDLATRYEQLRRDALMGTTSSTSVGLVVLLRQGLAAWIRACSYDTLSPARDLVPPLHTVDALPADVRSQAAVILAGILLHSRLEATS
jgi:hypothetical protein